MITLAGCAVIAFACFVPTIVLLRRSRLQVGQVVLIGIPLIAVGNHAGWVLAGRLFDDRYNEPWAVVTGAESHLMLAIASVTVAIVACFVLALIKSHDARVEEERRRGIELARAAILADGKVEGPKGHFRHRPRGTRTRTGLSHRVGHGPYGPMP